MVRQIVLPLAALAFLLPGSVPLKAQEPKFSEKIEVKLVEIDVSVTGRDGKPVHGLTRGDFEIYESGTKQEITNFTEYEATQTTPAGQLAAPSSTTSGVSAPSVPEPHQVLVLIDSLPRPQFVRSRVFDDLDALMVKTMHKGDTASVVYWSPGYERSLTIVEPTQDLELVRGELRKLGRTYTTDGGEQALTDVNEAEATFITEAKNFATSQVGPGGRIQTSNAFAGQQGGEFTGAMGLNRLARKAAGIQRLIASMSGHGKKVLLYVSNSFSLPDEGVAHNAAVELLTKLVSTANAAGVVFYAVRPAPFESKRDISFDSSAAYDETLSNPTSVYQTPMADHDASLAAIQSLTMPTGGLLEMGPRSIDSLGARLADDLGSYYSIAYQARSDGHDRERKIVVKAKGRGYKVRSRETYVEKSNATRARDEVMTRLFSGEDSDDVHFELEQGAPEKSSGDHWLLPVTLKVPIKQLQFQVEGSERAAYVRVLIAAGSGIAEATNAAGDALRIVESKAVAGYVSYTVKVLSESRGGKVSVGVLDARSGLLGVKSIDTRGMFH